MRKYNIFLFIFTFVLITNFNAWYILWLFPTIIWQKAKTIKFYTYICFGAILSYSISYFTYREDTSIGIPYLITMFSFAIGMSIIENKKIVEKKE